MEEEKKKETRPKRSAQQVTDLPAIAWEEEEEENKNARIFFVRIENDGVLLFPWLVFKIELVEFVLCALFFNGCVCVCFDCNCVWMHCDYLTLWAILFGCRAKWTSIRWSWNESSLLAFPYPRFCFYFSTIFNYLSKVPVAHRTAHIDANAYTRRGRCMHTLEWISCILSSCLLMTIANSIDPLPAC